MILFRGSASEAESARARDVVEDTCPQTLHPSRTQQRTRARRNAIGPRLDLVGAHLGIQRRVAQLRRPESAPCLCNAH